MLSKLVEVLKEVFWIKDTPKRKKKAVRKKPAPKKAAKKKTVKTVAKTAPKAVKKAVAAPKPAPIPKPPKAPKAPPKPVIDPNLVRVGEITHYFERIKVGVVKITQGTILIGDRLTIGAKGGPFVQKVWSMQIESQDVKVAKKGQLIGLKIDKLVAVGDIVYK